MIVTGNMMCKFSNPGIKKINKAAKLPKVPGANGIYPVKNPELNNFFIKDIILN